MYRNFYFPTLELLCYNLEAANSHPSYALDHLKDLASDVDKIQENLEMVDEYFGKAKNEVEIVRLLLNYLTPFIARNGWDIYAKCITLDR